MQNGRCHVVIPETVAAETCREISQRLGQAGLAGDSIAIPTLDPGSIVTGVLGRNAGLLLLPSGILRQSGLTEALYQLAEGARSSR